MLETLPPISEHADSMHLARTLVQDVERMMTTDTYIHATASFPDRDYRAAMLRYMLERRQTDIETWLAQGPANQRITVHMTLTDDDAFEIGYPTTFVGTFKDDLDRIWLGTTKTISAVLEKSPGGFTIYNAYPNMSERGREPLPDNVLPYMQATPAWAHAKTLQKVFWRTRADHEFPANVRWDESLRVMVMDIVESGENLGFVEIDMMRQNWSVKSDSIQIANGDGQLSGTLWRAYPETMAACTRISELHAAQVAENELLGSSSTPIQTFDIRTRVATMPKAQDEQETEQAADGAPTKAQRNNKDRLREKARMRSMRNQKPQRKKGQAKAAKKRDERREKKPRPAFVLTHIPTKFERDGLDQDVRNRLFLRNALSMACGIYNKADREMIVPAEAIRDQLAGMAEEADSIGSGDLALIVDADDDVVESYRRTLEASLKDPDDIDNDALYDGMPTCESIDGRLYLKAAGPSLDRMIDAIAEDPAWEIVTDDERIKKVRELSHDRLDRPFERKPEEGAAHIVAAWHMTHLVRITKAPDDKPKIDPQRKSGVAEMLGTGSYHANRTAKIIEAATNRDKNVRMLEKMLRDAERPR